jgi:hypothetical protein
MTSLTTLGNPLGITDAEASNRMEVLSLLPPALAKRLETEPSLKDTVRSLLRERNFPVVSSLFGKMKSLHAACQPILTEMV